MVERLASWILKYRKLVLGVEIGLTLIFLLAGLRLRVVTDFEAFFLPGDPDLQAYEELKKSFGSDEFVLVAYEAGQGVFAPEALDEVRALTDSLEKAQYVAQVISLTNAKEFRAGRDGMPAQIPIVPPGELTNLIVMGIQAKIDANPFYKNFLVSSNGKATFLLVHMKNPRNENFVRLKMTEEVEKAIEPLDKGNIHIAGTPIYLTALYRLILENMIWLGGIAVVLVVGLLWLSMRSLWGVLVPLSIMSLSILWNLGIFGLFGAPITIASSVVVPILVAISVTGSIYFLLLYTDLQRRGMKPEAALKETMVHIIPPGFFANVTTALGFLTLVTAQVLPVVQTGLYTSVGIMLSYLLTITLIPVLVSYFPHASVRPASREAEEAREGRGIVEFLDRLCRFNLKHPVALTVFWGAVTAVAVYGISMIRVETNPLTFFKKGSPIARNHEFFEKELGGTLPFEFVVKGNKGDFRRLDAYPNLDRLEKFLEAEPALHGVVGTPDVIREVNAAMTGKRAIPFDPDEFNQETRLVDLARNYMPLVGRFVDPNWQEARFTARIQAMTSNDLDWLLRRVEKYAKDNLAPQFEYKPSGIVKLLANMIDKLVWSQVTSFGMQIVLLWLCCLLFLRDWKLATLAIVPNVIPIVITLGVMGSAGIELNVATIMMPSIACGIAVDDTLHFMGDFHARWKGGQDWDEAIRSTLHFRGRAFIYTAFVLMAGFGILLVSRLLPAAHFGLISVVAIGSALVVELLLTAALLTLARPKGAA